LFSGNKELVYIKEMAYKDQGKKFTASPIMDDKEEG
jgi:hypothetical protein